METTLTDLAQMIGRLEGKVDGHNEQLGKLFDLSREASERGVSNRGRIAHLETCMGKVEEQLGDIALDVKTINKTVGNGLARRLRSLEVALRRQDPRKHDREEYTGLRGFFSNLWGKFDGIVLPVVLTVFTLVLTIILLMFIANKLGVEPALVKDCLITILQAVGGD